MSLGADQQYAALSEAINQVVEPRYRATVTLVQYPSQGDFAWCFQSPDGVFNQWTLDYLSARVLPGDAPGLAQLSEAGGLASAQSRLLSSLDYRLSSSDQRANDPALAGARLQANAMVARVRAATDSPDAGTGGLITVDPLSGAISTAWQPAYTVRTPIATILRGLGDEQSTIVATVPGPRDSTVTFTYTGVIMVATGPLAWQPSTGRGWHWPDPIGEAFRNGSDDVTGYSFRSPPPYAPGPVSSGGTLGRITGLLLSRPPTLGIQPAVEDSPGRLLTAGLSTTGSGTLSEAVLEGFGLLGLGHPDGVPYRQSQLTRSPGSDDLGASSSRGAVTTLLPEPAPSVPMLQQTAYVVGAVVQGA